MIERIQQLITEKKLSATQFSDEIGVQRSSLSHVLSGRNKPSLDFMLKIKARFPEVSFDWLLLGEGEMYAGSDDSGVQVPDMAVEQEAGTAHEPSVSSGSAGKGRHLGPVEYQLESPKQGNHDFTKMPEIGNKKIKQVLFIFQDDTFRVFLPEKK